MQPRVGALYLGLLLTLIRDGHPEFFYNIDALKIL